MLKCQKINEKYYALDNNPSFFQFGKNYHFYDKQGRIYQIASKNKNIFQNTQFKPKNMQKKNDDTHKKECLHNSYNYVTLFVKLKNPTVQWFTHKDINKTIILHRKIKDRNYKKEYEMEGNASIKLKAFFKNNQKRRTGTIQVTGLDIGECNILLNQSSM